MLLNTYHDPSLFITLENIKNEVFKGCRKGPLTLNVIIEKVLQICYFLTVNNNYNQSHIIMQQLYKT